MAENYFNELYKIDVRDKAKSKNGLTYLSWAAAWAEVKKLHPDAVYKVYEQDIPEVIPTGAEDDAPYIHMIKRPWFDDGNTGWVKTGVTINGLEHIEMLPIMDFKNKPIPADKITSMDANKAIQRSVTKACARHGLGLYIYEGEDLPEEAKEVETLQADIMALIKKKCALSASAKEKTTKICKEADESANGDPRLITDVETLKELKKKLLGVRK